MRKHKINGFTFFSARDPKEGINVGLFNLSAFANKNPQTESFQTWQCSANKENIEFRQIASIADRSLRFPIQTFLVAGRFPF